MAIFSFLAAAVQLQSTVDETCADVCASALCNGVNSPATIAAQDRYDAALDEQLLNILLADDEACAADYDYWG